MPTTAWQVRCLINMLHNQYAYHHDRILAYMFLREMYFISSCVHPDQQDHSMNHILIPGIFNPNYWPEGISAATLLSCMPNPSKPPGLTNMSPENALQLDEMAWYTILYECPGPNFCTGVVMDHTLRVNRQSIFRYSLM
jgi:hypothetical protein